MWEVLRKIPYGETISYGELARQLGEASASRAVGLANGNNPVAIIVPCHRVIGVERGAHRLRRRARRKAWLLDHESSEASLPGI